MELHNIVIDLLYNVIDLLSVIYLIVALPGSYECLLLNNY